MIELHPEFLTKNGKKEFVILPYEEFTALQELLADAADLRDLRAAKQDEQAAPPLSLVTVKNELNIEDWIVRHFSLDAQAVKDAALREFEKLGGRD